MVGRVARTDRPHGGAAKQLARAMMTAAGALALLAATSGPAAALTNVTIAGSFQSELGCPSDWQPGCALTHLTRGSDDGIWTRTFTLPAGAWEYKAAHDDDWTVNYGLHAQPSGANIRTTLARAGPVTFLYDPVSHWATDDRSATIATAAGDFQSELGCPTDWDPSCLRSWMEDADGDGVSSFHTTGLPPGSYEAKVAIDQSWDENYGASGVAGGADIPFTVRSGEDVVFAYRSDTHTMVIGPPGTRFPDPPARRDPGDPAPPATTTVPPVTTAPPPDVTTPPVISVPSVPTTTAPAVDRTAPRLRVALGRQSLRDVTRHGVAVTLRATESSRVAWRLLLPGNVVAGQGRVTLAAAAKRVRLRLSSSGRRHLARSSHPVLILATTTTDAAGNVSRARRSISLNTKHH
jgi:hypothetical protein